MIVPVSAAGTVSLCNHAGRVNLIADLTGYYTSAVGRTDVLSGGSCGFSEPSGIAFDGAHMWITNGAGSVTEVNTSDGSRVRTLSGGHYGFDIPWLAFDGTHLWIANYGLAPGDGSVTEVNASDGSWIPTLSGSSYAFSQPDAIASDGTHLWIANEFGNSVTEVNTSDGSLVRVLSGGSYAIDGPHLDHHQQQHGDRGERLRRIAGAGADRQQLQVQLPERDRVRRHRPVDHQHLRLFGNRGERLRRIAGPHPDARRRAVQPSAGDAFGGGHLWIANSPGISGIGYAPVNAVTELNAADGTLVRTMSGGFFTPLGGLAFDGTRLWIADYGHNSVIVAQG